MRWWKKMKVEEKVLQGREYTRVIHPQSMFRIIRIKVNVAAQSHSCFLNDVILLVVVQTELSHVKHCQTGNRGSGPHHASLESAITLIAGGNGIINVNDM